MALNIRLETSNKLLWSYRYINHPKQTILALEQDAISRDSALRQGHVAEYLEWTIKRELAGVVQRVDARHCSAEHILLLAQEAVHRFRRLANDPEKLLEVECDILDKRIRVAQRSNTSKGRQRETMSVYDNGRLFHQQTLEMERNELIFKIKPSCRSISPEAASTPSSDTSAGSKLTMEQAGGLISSKETANLLKDSSDISHMFDYISSQSFVKKNQRLKGMERMGFPTLHTALLFGTDQEARSSARRLESNDESVELVDFYKRKVAHVAAEVGRVHLLGAVLPRHSKSLDKADAFGLSPLIIAVLHGHLTCCKLLVDAGFDRQVRDLTGRNLLSIACRRRHLCIVEYLINELSFPPYDDSGRCFCSPIHDAIESGDLQICAFLINSGADVYQQFNKKTPGDLAWEKGQDSIFQLINEKIALAGWGQADTVSAHLGIQHYPYDSQTYDAASHSSNVPVYPPTAANTQYMDPQQLGQWTKQ